MRFECRRVRAVWFSVAGVGVAVSIWASLAVAASDLALDTEDVAITAI